MVESDVALKYHVFILAAGTHRVVIDLPRVRWSINGLTSESGSGKGSGVVAGYRYAQNTTTTSRLVLDLAKPALVAREFVLAPKKKDERYRIVLDLDPATVEAFADAADGSNSGPQPVAQQVARKPLIVIDPGHGGKDPGASSKKGLREKDIVLDAAGNDTAIVGFDGYELPAGVERLLLAGDARIAGGNADANLLFGNALGNQLRGLGGNDVLDGGLGADKLTGGSNNDEFLFHKGEANGDIISDFVGNGSAAGDTIHLVGWAAGSTMTLVSGNVWAVTDSVDHSVENISITGAVHVTDILFG